MGIYFETAPSSDPKKSRSREISRLGVVRKENIEGPSKSVEELVSSGLLPEISFLQEEIESDAERAGAEETLVHQQEILALREASAIFEGQTDPNKAIKNLPSNRIFVSFSRFNPEDEKLAKEFQLGLQRAGMVVWMDNQETNLKIGAGEGSGAFAQRMKREKKKKEGKQKRPQPLGISMGSEDWAEDIDKAITKDSYGVYVFSVDALQKPEICAKEIVSIREVGTEVLFMIPEGEKDQVVETYNEVRRRTDDEVYAELPDISKLNIIQFPRETFFEDNKAVGNYTVDTLDKVTNGKRGEVILRPSEIIESRERAMDIDIKTLTEKLIKKIEWGSGGRVVLKTESIKKRNSVESVEDASIILRVFKNLFEVVDNLDIQNVHMVESINSEELRKINATVAENFAKIGFEDKGSNMSLFRVPADLNKSSRNILFLTPDLFSEENKKETISTLKNTLYQAYELDSTDLVYVWVGNLFEQISQLEEEVGDLNEGGLSRVQALRLESEDDIMKKPDAFVRYMTMKYALIEKARSRSGLEPL